MFTNTLSVVFRGDGAGRNVCDADINCLQIRSEGNFYRLVLGRGVRAMFALPRQRTCAELLSNVSQN